MPHNDETLSAHLPAPNPLDGTSARTAEDIAAAAAAEAEAEAAPALWTAPAAAIAFVPSDLSCYCSKFKTKLGEGAYGAVFFGTLPDGRQIAVKQMELTPEAAAKKKKKKEKKSGDRARCAEPLRAPEPGAADRLLRREREIINLAICYEYMTMNYE